MKKLLMLATAMPLAISSCGCSSAVESNAGFDKTKPLY